MRVKAAGIPHRQIGAAHRAAHAAVHIQMGDIFCAVKLCEEQAHLLRLLEQFCLRPLLLLFDGRKRPVGGDSIDIGRTSSAAGQAVGAAGRAALAALWGGRTLAGNLIFPDQKLLADAEVQMIPRHHLVVVAVAVGVESRVQSALGHRIVPALRVEVLVPAVQLAALLPGREDNRTHSAVTLGQNRLDKADVGVVVADADLFGLDAGQQVFLLFAQQLHRVLPLKLEGGKGLWHKAGAGDGDADRPALRAGGQAVVEVDHLLRKVGDALDVLHRLGRQAHHKVELDRGVAALKGGLAGGEHLLLGDVFVDDVPQALGAGLGGEGKAALFDAGDLLHQFLREVVHPKAWQRQAHPLLWSPGQQVVQQRLDLQIVAGGQRGQRQLLIAAGVAQAVGVMV